MQSFQPTNAAHARKASQVSYYFDLMYSGPVTSSMRDSRYEIDPMSRPTILLIEGGSDLSGEMEKNY